MVQQITDLTSIELEDQLLLACAVKDVQSPHFEYIRSLVAQNLDWATVCHRAAEHKLTPLLYRNLIAICPDAVPEPYKQQMRNFCKANRGYSLILTAQMIRLLELLAQHGIEAVPFKGPILAWCAYGDLSLRYYADIDLVVQEADVDKAKSLLAAEGYVRPASFSINDEVILRKWGYSYELENPESKIKVELHWRLAPTYLSFNFDYQLLWQNRQAIQLLASTIKTFSPEDTFLILCMHATKHNWQILCCLSDITEFIRLHPRLDWAYIDAQSRKLRIRRMVLLSLKLVNDLLQAPIPSDLLQQINADKQVAKLAQWAKKWLFVNKVNPVNTLDGYTFQLRVRESWRDKYLYLRIKQPLLREDAEVPQLQDIPQVDTGLYFLLRLLRLLRRYLVRPFKRIVGKMRAAT
jgi:hypothetical protein